MKKQKTRNEGQFRQFVDETSPEQAAEVQKNWRRKTKQQKNKLFTRILVIATLVVALIFVVTLNVFIDNKKQHVILDQDKEGYTLVQTTFPHLKVLVDKQIQTYETKMVRSAGIVYAELVSWIEANVASNNKILYIPNQKSGTTLLGMALGYYLSTSNGGSLDILIESEGYKQHLAKNTEQMKNFNDENIVFNYLNNKDQIKNDYQLVIVQNNNILEQISLNKFKKIVEIRKKKWDNASIGNYMKSYSKYEINKGKFNSEALALGQFKSYSLVQLKESIREEYKIILILISPQPNLNLCPEQVSIFKASSEKRNLLEYFRNITLAAKQRVFYCLDDTHTLKSISQLENIADFFIGGANAIQSIKEEKLPYSASIKHTYILTLSDFNKQKTKLKGEILILINSPQQVALIETLVSNSAVKMISPFNNNGCLFPALVLPYRSITPFHAFFLKVTKN